MRTVCNVLFRVANLQKWSICFSLTVYVEHDPLGHGRRDVVGRDAEVGAHLVALQLLHLEAVAAVAGH